MTSEGNNALLPANVDLRPPLLLPLHVFRFVLCFSGLRLGETLRFSGNKMNCFPRDQSLGSLSMRVFETRTATGRENFACQDSGVPQILILIISNGEKILSNVNVVL